MQKAEMEKPDVEWISFQASPAEYKHWQLRLAGAVATLVMDVQEDGGLRNDYRLKLNSYDLAVDIELADAIERIRFEHPEVRTLVLSSAKDRIFCAGANIFMLGISDHVFKVNFCKFTNETRLALEDASRHSHIQTLAAVNGTCAGGGYELALACDHILLIDDGSSAVSLPETPLLGVLPGTGGLTRLIDKRRVRRDHADVFATSPEGIRGKKAVDWRLVDVVVPRRDFPTAMSRIAQNLAENSPRQAHPPGLPLPPIMPKITGDALRYRYVTLLLNREKRLATLRIQVPQQDLPTVALVLQPGGSFWFIQLFRELDRALLHLRFNEPSIGLVLLQCEGHAETVLQIDSFLMLHSSHWLVREMTLLAARVFRRLDLTSKSFFALVSPGSCFVGSLLELCFAADRIYMLEATETFVQLTEANFGSYPQSNHQSRLENRFFGDSEHIEALRQFNTPLSAVDAFEQGLVTSIPDHLDWDDEMRLAIEERLALSPDALTAMEANLRFVGPETLETRIFGRLSAWQNWVFQRPNAVGERGALKVYGQAGRRPEFDWRRT